jgi:hypothetical protein
MAYPFKKSEAAKLLASDDTYAFVLMTILLPVFGDDLFTEDSSILFADIEDYFDCHLSEESENRINAAITAMTTDLFFTNVNMFNSIALAFAEGDIGDIPEGILETPDVGDMLWAVQEVSLLIGEPKESEEFQSMFSPSVMSYVGDMIASVAEDLDEVPDDVDELDEAFDEPYFERVINENTAQMVKQLYMIGVDPTKLAGSDLSN